MANPVFGHRMRDERVMLPIVRAWDVVPPRPFLGGRQPYAPRKRPPALLSVNSPPGYINQLLELELEDSTAYFRAQRWPADKTIVSVDNPPRRGDDQTTDTLQIIYGIWNIPPPPSPQTPKKIAVAAQPPSATGALSSAGAGTASWIANSLANTAPKVAYPIHIINTWSMPASLPQVGRKLPQSPVASASADLFSQGVGTASWVGAYPSAPPGYQWELLTLDPEDTTLYLRAQPKYKVPTPGPSTTGAVLSAGIGTATWAGSFTQPVVPKATPQLHIFRAWEAPIVITQVLPQQAIGGATGALSSAGSATAGFAAALSQNTAPRKFIQHQTYGTWAPQYLIIPPHRYFPQAALSSTGAMFSLGLSSGIFVGADAAAVAFRSSGMGLARFQGKAVGAAVSNRDGWRVRARDLERRRRKDEEEIMAIAKAVLPLLRSGIKQPMRIHL